MTAHARLVHRKWRRKQAGPSKPQVPWRQRVAAASEAVDLSFGWRPQAGLAKGHSGASHMASRRLQARHLRCVERLSRFEPKALKAA
eukprot:5762881-Heterocapsa_arctica.AAC.1